MALESACLKSPLSWMTVGLLFNNYGSSSAFSAKCVLRKSGISSLLLLFSSLQNIEKYFFFSPDKVRFGIIPSA